LNGCTQEAKNGVSNRRTDPGSVLTPTKRPATRRTRNWWSFPSPACPARSKDSRKLIPSWCSRWIRSPRCCRTWGF